jgi:putative DNA-invertase from lambdoid prophage Rac
MNDLVHHFCTLLINKLMSRTFAYIRVSKYSQDSDNQIGEIETAGFSVEPHRIIKETILVSVLLTNASTFLSY